MNDRRKSNKLEGLQLGLFIFECGMSIFYLAGALVCLAPSLLHLERLFTNVQSGLRIVLGVVLGIYGIFRVYRAIKKIKELENTEE
ncbi:hypothetical protein AGMMS50262_02080 [Bacteroidia bacterium]|nr:hypothetical protein AGMMS50262_02080 [Bacteroidia bacterium]